jgi:Glycosyltransferase family 87
MTNLAPRRLGWIALALWAAVILAVTIRGMAAPHQNSVFLVFREAGRDWLAGEPLYTHVGKYLYSPLAAAFFSIFALIPEWVGSGIWRLVSGTLYLLSCLVWFRWMERAGTSGNERERAGASGNGWERAGTSGSGRERAGTSGNERKRARTSGAWWQIALLLLLPLSIGNLNNGQASPLLIALLLLACLAVEERRWTLAAAAIAAAAYFKIYPLAIGLLLIVLEPQKLWWRLAIAIVILGGASFILGNSPGYVVDQYRAWGVSLASDQRRVATELGTWRDFWLLLRILHVPITVGIYAILQLAMAAGAAFFCWWRFHVSHWNRSWMIWTAFALGCLWITLFGPSTELATYIFLAPSVVLTCAWVLRTETNRIQLGWRWILPLTAYALLVAAEALNAWVPVVRQNIHLHAIQPIGALIFAGFILGWVPPVAREPEAGVTPVFPK